jgi:methionine synthase I (cobalamin-dependent)
MKTAVEQLQEYLSISLGPDRMRLLFNEFEKAKEMEKEQIIDAFFEGKNDGILMERYSDYKHISPNEYYNETFKTN